MNHAPPAVSAESALFELAEAVRDTGYRFVTVTPATHRRVNDRPANRWARSLEDVFGWSRPFRADLLPPKIVGLMERAHVLEEGADGWRSRVRVSTLASDLFLHSAFPTTAADAVFFGPDTYRFVSALTAHLQASPSPVRRAVDIGCGAGPGAVAVAKARPDAEVTMVDINDAALGLARVNAALAGVPHVTARRSDLLSGVDGAFDLIVANPPYLSDDHMRAYRHGGGPLGAGLSLAIVETAAERLAPGGTLVLYTGAAIVNGEDPFREAAAERLAAAGLDWSYREVDPDVFGEELDRPAYAEADRIAAVVLTARRQR
jgi:methylase of polypeptide subunit release factors